VCISENDITDIIDETFTTTEERFGEMVTIDLKPGGADVPVTEDNKRDYVELVVDYRISKRVKEQFEAFMSGFSELIPQELITVFDERELELLIGGMSEIDVYGLFYKENNLNCLMVFDCYTAMTGQSLPITEGTR
jgi:E3 ubiquitin-protein ligase NEDD4